jgi:tRNA threonylcarbamoyl adenosine modification protein YjeE
MESLAVALADLLAAGDAVTLRGEVGAGKTTFARALIHAIACGAPEVTSPTFNLMQSYDVMLKHDKPEALWHLDLYRLEHANELAALGLEELWPHIVLIEWPEVAAGSLPGDRLDIAFSFDDSQSTRSLTFAGNDAWRERLDGLI